MNCSGNKWLPVRPDDVDLNKLLMDATAIPRDRLTFSLHFFSIHNLAKQGWWVEMENNIQHSQGRGIYHAAPIEAVLNALAEVVDHD